MVPQRYPRRIRLPNQSRVLRALEQRARALRLSFLTLEVRESNAAAVALYEKHGFHRVGLRRNYYERPKEDALIMTKYF